MPRYETYQSNAAELPMMRKWILRALVISILLHAGLFIFFHFQKLESFGNIGMERLAPPVRVMTRVNIPKIPDEDTRLVLPDKVPNVAKIALPEDKPQVQEVRVSPQLPEVTKPIVSEKPKVDMSGWDALAKVEAQTRGAMEKTLNSMAGSLIDKAPHSPLQPRIKLPPSSKFGEGGIGDAAGIPGRLTLDQALERTGPLPVGDKPIGMPGGALFEYNMWDLRDDAKEQLRKLGELIKRNPKATFSIEGHTDSTGTPEYNQTLSERRAESVKKWLVENMGIAPERIQTRGFGSAKLIVSGDKSVEEQQPNRRVEIVIKTNRK
jgi:outer membrane protein OmpA-like peptidoglycan-associated protein